MCHAKYMYVRRIDVVKTWLAFKDNPAVIIWNVWLHVYGLRKRH